jgi:hypothetical protein
MLLDDVLYLAEGVTVALLIQRLIFEASSSSLAVTGKKEDSNVTFRKTYLDRNIYIKFQHHVRNHLAMHLRSRVWDPDSLAAR